ncbi:T9SS type A sorting domain-containing protein [Flavobacteriaceae bacterium]|nr:T9SS type A sorting domain-containing protein [Flavobacteriaceae bacterium]
MKKIYTLLFATSLMCVMSAQTTVDFTLEEGYVQGPLDSNPDWGGENWFVNPTPGTERAETTAGYSWARWGTPFIVSDTEISFEVYFKFNVDLPAGKLISRFGFNDNGSSSGNIANIQLSTLNDGSLYIRKQGNTPVDIGSAGLTNFQQDDLVLNIVLTLGADAASSTLSSTIINVTDNINPGLAVVTGIPEAVFNAATSGGISGFIHAQDNINGTRSFLVDKVVMTQGSTLNLDSHKLPTFNVSQNPIQDIVKLNGVTRGSEISIYTVTGAKVNNYVYDGNQLNLGHLNPGVYFLQVPGYRTQKLIKK